MYIHNNIHVQYMYIIIVTPHKLKQPYNLSILQIKPGSQYNASTAFCFVSSSTVVELWSIPLSVTVEWSRTLVYSTVSDGRWQYAVLVLYCEPAFKENW